MKNTEHKHQVALMQWADLNKMRYPELQWLFAIPNGGHRDIRVAKKLKAEGVKAGVSDLCLPVARGRFNGFFAELKAPGGSATAKQKDFIQFAKSQGYHADVYQGWESVRDALVSYLESLPPKNWDLQKEGNLLFPTPKSEPPLEGDHVYPAEKGSALYE